MIFHMSISWVQARSGMSPSGSRLAVCSFRLRILPCQ